MRKTAALAVGGLTLALALSACSSDDQAIFQPATAKPTSTTVSTFDTLGIITAAEEKTVGVKTAKFTLKMELMDSSITTKGETFLDGERSAMSGTMNIGGDKSEFRLVDGTMYVRYPEATRRLLEIDKPWARLITDKEESVGDSISQMSSNDLAETFAEIKKAGTITKSERTQLNGQPVTHYSVDIDLAKADAKSFENLPQQWRDIIKNKGVHYPVELWLDDKQLPAQIVVNAGPALESALKDVGYPPGLMGPITMQYTDWGAPVNIKAPSADQVTDYRPKP